ncbi:MAG: 6-phosphofructokinase [Chlamydiae bacterium]|nr:6-phosphofructokinase [Chlamydiota bacterium]MBI3267159.1 6-phosphofructokinase [Chlamydiota bacterium]
MRRIGVLTGGGDCPGLNPVLRGIVRKAILEKYEVVGFLRGWAGIIEGDYKILDRSSVSGILHMGGTILNTSRTNPYKKVEDVKKVIKNFKSLELEALIAIGGDDTLGVAQRLFREEHLPTVAIPKTIDNDLNGTDCTFGFDTAVNIAMEAIDRLHTTAASHNRVMVVELMGRNAGWIALQAGIAGGADVIIIPEVEVTVDEVCTIIKRRHKSGRNFSIVAVAEGAKFGKDLLTRGKELDQFGHEKLGGIGDFLAREIEKRTGFETRITVLGHLQRGGSPTAFDRVLGTRFGVKAVELVESKEFGKMVSLRGTQVVSVDLSEALSKLRTADLGLYEMSKVFFG